jgi:hypothetical protein
MEIEVGVCINWHANGFSQQKYFYYSKFLLIFLFY